MYQGNLYKEAGLCEITDYRKPTESFLRWEMHNALYLLICDEINASALVSDLCRSLQ